MLIICFNICICVEIIYQHDYLQLAINYPFQITGGEKTLFAAAALNQKCPTESRTLAQESYQQ